MINDEKSDEDVVIDYDHQLAKLTATPEELISLLDKIEHDILPLTAAGVDRGNKVFGAAILSTENGNVTENSKDDNSLYHTVLAQTNAELLCPLFHGEVHAIWQWSQIIPPSERGRAAKSSVFLSTHEPCCMCISSIVWAGFTKIYYLFPYTMTSKQGIPHDLNIMHELWGVPSYRKQNKFCSASCLFDLVADLSDDEPLKDEAQATLSRLISAYDQLSKKYHAEKQVNKDNTLTFG